MDIKEIGRRIKKARTIRNYTLDYIASEIGVAKSTIQRYENGLIVNPKLPVLQSIADTLRVNPAWLSGQQPGDYRVVGVSPVPEGLHMDQHDRSEFGL